MSFIHPFFLFLLPLIVIPLLLSLISRLNRKKAPFPSIELLQDIIRRDRTARTILIRLKQVIRALIVALVVTAFAQPFFGDNSTGGKTIALIDPTLSMARFDLNRIASELSGEFSAERIYFGVSPLRHLPLRHSPLRQEGENRFAVDALQMDDIVRQVIRNEGSGRLVLVTDGQECNFRSILRLPPALRSLLVLRPFHRRQIRNIFVRNAETFPGVVYPGQNAEFLADIGGNPAPGDRVRIYLNGREIYNERAETKISFSRVLDANTVRPGLNTGMVLLEGDDFTNDNRFYFPVPATSMPSVYSDIDSPVIRRIFGSIFPEYTVADIPEAADVVFTGRDLYIPKNKPAFFFCEDIKTTENILRKNFHEFAEFESATASGDLTSEDPALSMVRNVSVRTKYRLKSDTAEASAGGVPLAYRFDNIALFPFSVRENEDTFSDSASLLLLVNHFLMGFYHDRTLFREGDPALKNRKFFDANGSVADIAVTCGVLTEKESGKFFFHNPTEESYSVLLSENDLRNKLTGIPQGHIGFRNFDADKNEPAYPGFLTGMVLMALALALALLELV